MMIKMKTVRRIATVTALLMIGSGIVSTFSGCKPKEGKPVSGESVIVGNVRIQPLSETIVRIELKGPNGFEDRETYNIVTRDFTFLPSTVTTEGDVTSVKTEAYTVTVPNNADSLDDISVVNTDGRTVWTYSGLPSTREYLPEPGDTPDAWAIADTPRIVPAEWGYDLMPEGETEFAEFNGWDTTNDSPDMYVLVSNGDYRTLLQDFITLTGPSEMIPLKAFGLWYSKYYNFSQSEALAAIDKFAEEGFPLDYFGVDTDWRVGGRTGYELNTSQWPDLQGFIDTVHNDKHLSVYFNDHAAPIDNAMFNDDAFTNGAHALLAAEIQYRHGNLGLYLNMGLDMWWYDRNWPHSIISPFETLGISRDNFGMYVYHSITQSVNPDKRPMIMGNVDGVDTGTLARAANLTSHRYSVQWTGDTESSMAYLKQDMSTIVRSGVLTATPYVCFDAGGHAGTQDGASFIRWTQYAALSPVFRYHSAGGSSDRAPWLYGETAEDAAREYTELRYRLLPVFYSLAFENYTTGLPINRRLDINYPAYIESQDDTQYLLGDNILVAPLYSYSNTGNVSRTVFIPDGRWINAFTGESYIGPQTVTVSCDIDSMPIFVRSGSIIPTVESVNYIGEKDWSKVSLDVYPSTQLEGSFTLYEDDGQSVAYKNGAYRTTELTTGYDAGKGEVTVNIAAAEGKFEGSDAFDSREWTVRIHAPSDWGNIESVTLNGKTVSPSKIACVNDTIPFGGAGTAAGDGDVYELTFTEKLTKNSEIRIKFASPQDEALPEYNSVSVNMDEVVAALVGNTDLDSFGTSGWTRFTSSDRKVVTAASSKGGIIANLITDGSFNEYAGTATFTQSGSSSFGVSDGEISFDIPVGTEETMITFFVGVNKATGRLEITDGSSKHAKIIDVTNLTGSKDQKISVTVSAATATKIHVRFRKTEGSGDAALYAVAASEKKNIRGSEVQIESFVSDVPATVNFSSSDVIDWVHLGYGNSATAVTRKKGANILSDPVITGKTWGANNYPSKISFGGGTPIGATADDRSAIKFENMIEFTVPVTAELQELKIYTGVTYATNTVEIFDEAGTPVTSYQFSTDGGKCITVQFKGEENSVIHVRTRRTYGRTGTCMLAGYTLSAISEASKTTSELKSAVAAAEAKYTLGDLKKFTSESVEAYRDAILNAKIVSRKDPVTKEEVDSAIAALTAADSGLTENSATDGTDLIGNATATASSRDNDSHMPDCAIDDNRDGTRWAAKGGTSTDWLAIDLGEKKTFDRISVYWESVSHAFEIQVSDDGQNWTAVASDESRKESAGARVTTETYFDTVTARYIRIYSTARATDSFGGAYLSILDIKLYNTGISIEATPWEELAKLADNPVADLTLYAESDVEVYEKALSDAVELFKAGTTDDALINAALDALQTAKDNLREKEYNAALGATVTTSLSVEGTNTADRLADGKMNTRWASSNGGADQTVTLDLGSVESIHRVALFWESASNDYVIEISVDGTTFTQVAAQTQSVSAGAGGSNIHEFESVDARYVRLHSKKGAPGLGTYLSLYEFEVYAANDIN